MSNNITKFLNSRVIELSSDKIELSSVKELQKYVSILSKNISEAEKSGAAYGKAEGEMVRAWATLQKDRNTFYSNAFSSAPKVISEFQQKAKELGLDVSSVKEVKELEKLISELKNYVKLFDTIKRPAEQI